jgi:tRNA U34 5-methylaminomethyl-2-thiouridine-forming methyltransferase MnmC
MQRKLVLTSDGSHTLYVEELNEHYHSTHGAVQESMHVYIQAGLMPLVEQKDKLDILEMGFGTGLNALLTMLNAPDTKINYTTIEAYPLTAEELAALNYSGLFKDSRAGDLFMKMHNADWGVPVTITDNFTITKLHEHFESLTFESHSFDLVYYDAFAPAVQPELWKPEIFKKIYFWMTNHGVLVTYCAKGEFKRTLAAEGFHVVILPGPPGKNQITKAVKMNEFGPDDTFPYLK